MKSTDNEKTNKVWFPPFAERTPALVAARTTIAEMNQEIKWTVSVPRDNYTMFTSDCGQYTIVIQHGGNGTVVLNDYSMENSPVAYTEHCSSFKQAKKLANGWKQGGLR